MTQRLPWLVSVFTAGLMLSGDLRIHARIWLIGHWTAPDALSDVWGYQDSITGRTYALVGGVSGTYIVEITQPDSPLLRIFIPGPRSVWRDIKTWQYYAYIVHDLTQDSPVCLQIVDMSQIGTNDTILVYTWDFGGTIESAHNLWIDEKGRLFLWGATTSSGSSVNLIADLTGDPLQPGMIGVYQPPGVSPPYIHDGYVKNDTLFGAHIYAGLVSIAHIVSSSSIPVIGTTYTPGMFAHNVWAEGRWMVSTDERTDAPVVLWDISDPSSPQMVAQFNSTHSVGSIPHNAIILGDLVFVSHYTDGVIQLRILPQGDLQEIGWYDTSPLSGEGFYGCWGVYPFLDSLVLASDIEQGLYILGWDTVQDPALGISRAEHPEITGNAHIQWVIWRMVPGQQGWWLEWECKGGGDVSSGMWRIYTVDGRLIGAGTTSGFTCPTRGSIWIPGMGSRYSGLGPVYIEYIEFPDRRWQAWTWMF